MSAKEKGIDTNPTIVDPDIPTDPAELRAWLTRHHDKIGTYMHVQCCCLLAISEAITQAAWAICDMGDIHAELTLKRVKDQAKEVFPSESGKESAI